MLRLTTLLALVALAPEAHAQDLGALDSVIKQRLERSKVPGLSVATINPEGVIHEHSYGLRSAESKEPVVAGMLFRPGSATKTWTAAALLKAMEQRQLSVMQPIGSFIPSLRPDLAKLTVHQLLSHTSGLADSGTSGQSLDDEAISESVAKPGSYVAFAEPGKVFSYSNPGYQLAGYVLERLTKSTFADAIDALLLVPLGAESATYRATEAITYPVAVGHEIDSKGSAKVLRPMDHGVLGAPSGYAFSSSSDLVRFARMLLNDGKAANGTRVLSTSVIAAMTKRYAAVTESAGEMGYGYGLWIEQANGQPFWHHGGGLDGFNSQVTMLPGKKIAMAAVANASGSASLVSDVIILIRKQVDPAPTTLSRRPSSPELKPQLRPVAEPLASQLVGRWGAGEFEFFVRRKDGVLSYYVGSTLLGTLHAGENDRLRLYTPGGANAGYVGIVRDTNNRPVYMTWGARATSRRGD